MQVQFSLQKHLIGGAAGLLSAEPPTRGADVERGLCGSHGRRRSPRSHPAAAHLAGRSTHAQAWRHHRPRGPGREGRCRTWRRAPTRGVRDSDGDRL